MTMRKSYQLRSYTVRTV